ncbi:MAG: hypothetical protein ACJ73S_05710 [Mycobacteriales bacterium]
MAELSHEQLLDQLTVLRKLIDRLESEYSQALTAYKMAAYRARTEQPVLAAAS